MQRLFVAVKRQRTCLFLDFADTEPLLAVKKAIAGILRVSPDKQRLFLNGDQVGVTFSTPPRPRPCP